MTLNRFCEKCNIGFILDEGLGNRNLTCPRCGSALQEEIISVVEVLDENAENSLQPTGAVNKLRTSPVEVTNSPSHLNAPSKSDARWASPLVIALGATISILAGTLGLLLTWYFWSGSGVAFKNSPPSSTNQSSQVSPEAPAPLANPSATSDEAETNVPPVTTNKKSTASSLDEVKAATVYIRCVSRDQVGMGSGFLAHAAENRGLIVTNAHVVESDDNSVPKIQCVFNAGQRGEFTVDAKILALDSKVDIAVLEVNHNYLPKPLDYASRIEFKETKPGLVLGYPYGENLATNDRSPAITVSSCKITSLRRDEFEQIRMLQVDGGINPGNSGGPMVSEDGALVGIAVAKVSNSEIGFVIPQTELQSFMAGRATTFAINEVTLLSSRIAYAVTLGIVDPLEQITDANLMGFENIAREVPDSDGQWKLIQRPALFSVPFAISRSSTDENLNQTKVTFEIPNGSKHVGAQIQIKRKDGSEWYSTIHMLPDEYQRPKVIGRGSNLNTADGQISHIVFPNPYSDFCLNTTNGDVIAVDPVKNVAARFTREQLMNPKDTPPTELKVGGMPSAIIFKQFENASYYLVLCRQDPNVFVINAQDFTLTRKIPIGDMGGTSICSSLRIDDPFVYYNFGTRNLQLGLLNLRNLTDSGGFRKSVEDCSISSDGTVIYLLGNGSQVETWELTSNPKSDAMQLNRMTSFHTASYACSADSLGEFTGSGKRIFDKKVTKTIATLDASPVCFFRDRPLVIGTDNSFIQAFSTNSLKPIGRRVKLVPLLSTGMPLFWANPSYESIQTVPVKSRVFADESKNQVIVATGKYLMIVPLSAFDIPSEHLLALEVGKTDFKVGLNSTLVIKSIEPDAKLELSDLPEGAKPNANGFAWVPSDEQVGTHILHAKLSLDSVSKEFEIELNVSQPSLSTNFAIADFNLDPTNSYICCWGQVSPKDRLSDSRDKPAELTSEVAIVPLRSGLVAAQKTISGIRQAKYNHPFLAVLPENDPKRVDLYKVPNLDRVKSLIAKSPIEGVNLKSDKIGIQAGVDSKSYSLTTFEPVPDDIDDLETIPLREGLLRDGVLYDFASTPLFIVEPRKIPQLSATGIRPLPSLLNRSQQGFNIITLADREGIVNVSGPQPLVKTGLYISLETTIRNQVASADSVLGGMSYDVDILIQDSKPTMLTRLPIVKRICRDGVRELPPKMRAANEHVFISFDRAIYRWSPNPKQLATLKSPELEKLQVVPKQMVFVLTQPTATLQHEVRGGEPPYEFILTGINEELELNSENGSLQINKEKLSSTLKKALLRITGDKTDSKVIAEKLGPVQEAAINQVEKTFGKRPTGLPMALPVHFKVLDNRGTAAELLYFVIVVFSQSEVDKALSAK